MIKVLFPTTKNTMKIKYKFTGQIKKFQIMEKIKKKSQMAVGWDLKLKKTFANGHITKQTMVRMY